MGVLGTGTQYNWQRRIWGRGEHGIVYSENTESIYWYVHNLDMHTHTATTLSVNLQFIEVIRLAHA